MMLSIEAYTLGPLATNAYLLRKKDSNQAVVIDPGMHPEPLLRELEGLQVEAILLTHAHFDHIGGVDVIRKRKHCPVYIHDIEADWLTNPQLNGSLNWPELGPPISTAAAEFSLRDGQRLTLLDEQFLISHTPGHSPGSVSIQIGEHLFSGDVLFNLSVGRTDLNGGSSQELYDSIHNKLFKLPGSTNVYPGHGPQTTIQFEKDNNPYL